MGSAASACPRDQRAAVLEQLKAEMDKVVVDLKDESLQDFVFPDDFDTLEALPQPTTGDAVDLYTQLSAKLSSILEKSAEHYEPVVLKTQLKNMPQALEQAVYVHERWPLILDPSSQGLRFMRYQKCIHLLTMNPHDMEPENLREKLVLAMSSGSILMLNFEEAPTVDLECYFSATHFPREILDKTALFKKEVYSSLLRSEKGDPNPEVFMPKDEFMFAVVTKLPSATDLAAARDMCVIDVVDPSAKSNANSRGGGGLADSALAEAFGVRDVKRNSVKMVEAAFDGEWNEVKEWIDKGYSIESEDTHNHTAISEAACQVS
jgi:hypothetical protein